VEGEGEGREDAIGRAWSGDGLREVGGSWEGAGEGVRKDAHADGEWEV
jgi:hypothetical protein